MVSENNVVIKTHKPEMKNDKIFYGINKVGKDCGKSQ